MHFYLLKRELQLRRHAYQTAYTQKKDILTEYIYLVPTREIFYSSSSVKELFKKLN